MNQPAPDESLIARILEQPLEERAEFLRRMCVETPGMRDRLLQIGRVISSLEADTRSTPLPVSDSERARIFELAFARQEAAGTTIGQYRLIEELGEGGFGVVWLAEQQEPIRRRVALKVIKSGMDSREVISRFETERQSLALMDHPGIARVLDAGTTEAGRPFFVMELVRGAPITRYCDENRLTVEARLRLFISVCRAVQHAHQKGVIHRDIKPSNIIVAQHDGTEFAKIIDFGIAKATEAPAAGRTLFTRFHAFIGTPTYTSPEQMEMSGLDVDTRSDIYSLGVLLYELLAGCPPFDPSELLKTSLEEMRRTIREIEPPTPSASVCELGAGAVSAISHNRATDPRGLAGELRGDLDWIVMHCLEKDRTRRYETAGELAADVARHLASEPVLARPAGAAYRVGKFVRRNKLVVSAGAVVVVSLVTGLVVASVALVREHAAREREGRLRIEADASAAQANLESAKSAQVARFMKDMLSGVGPSDALGRDTTMLREILDSTAKRLDSELHDQPEVATELRETLALVYRDLGRFQEAEALLREVVRAKERIYGPQSGQLATSLNNHGSVLGRLARDDDAQAELNRALAIRTKLFGDESPVVADTLFELAQVATDARGLEESRRMLYRVLDIRRKALGAENMAVAQTLDALGANARLLFGHQQAVELQRQAVAMYRRVLGPDHPELARALDSLGYSLRHISWTDEAKEPYREAYFIRRKVLGAEHPDLVVSFLRYVGEIPAAKADQASIDLIRGFVAEQRARLPAKSPLLAPALFAYAAMLDRPDRDPARASALLAEANQLVDDSITGGFPPDEDVVGAMSLYGWWKFLDGDAGEGRAMCEAGLRLSLSIHAKHPGALVMANHILGWVDYGDRKFESAAKQFREVIRLIHSSRFNRHPFLGVDLAGFGAACRKLGRLEEAEGVIGPELAGLRQGNDPDSREVGSLFMALGEYGLVLNELGRFAEAEPVFRECLRAGDAKSDKQVGLRLTPRGGFEMGLGAALAGQKRFEEAEQILLHGFNDLKEREPSFAGERGAIMREARAAMFKFYSVRGLPEKAAPFKGAGATIEIPDGPAP